MDNLVIILQNISATYEGSLEGPDGHDDSESYASNGSNNFNILPAQGGITLDDRRFVLCARPPRGFSTFIPTFLALFGGKNIVFLWDVVLMQLFTFEATF